MKKILGLDLGVSSIGWALIHEGDEGQNNAIIDMGVRIIPLSTDEKDEFSKGNKISKNQKRTLYRSQRRGLDRYQQRREKLKRVLIRENMYPEEYLFQLSNLEVYGLRSRAASQKIDPRELGRVLLLLNQRRGYRGTRAEEAEEAAASKKTESSYLSAVKNRHQQILEKNQTVGQHFFEELVENPRFRIKNLVFPRKAYIDEFNAIAAAQGLPETLTRELRDEVIYFQRPLKSKKGLVSVCEFAGFTCAGSNGVEKWHGPKVAPVSSPVSQVCRIWEHINNLTIKTKINETITLTTEQKRQLFDVFNSHEKVTFKIIAKTLNFNERDYNVDKLLEKGIQGNITRHAIQRVLGGKYPELLRFDLEVVENRDKDVLYVNSKSAEVVYQGPAKCIASSFEKEPFYQLWHTIYSIQDLQECSNALQKRFSIDADTAERLAYLDLTKAGFSNKSVKAMRNILPYLMQGLGYSVACSLAGYNHSDSITKEENENRELRSRIALLPKNHLRQPVVEKILNQMIHVVNTIGDTYGAPDEIRVELARELRQSQEERNKTYRSLNERERENKKIAMTLGEYKIRATRNNIIKYRLFQEVSGDNIRTNATCLYCGKMFGFVDAMNGNSVDVEHIIPQQLRFDDAQSNKTLAHRSCNLEKGNATAFDYMMTKSKEQFDAYIQRINEFKDKRIISYTKYKNLTTSAEKLDNKEFIARQLQETRYISKKAMAILRTSCRNVHATSGKVTEYLRRIWGWNDVLLNLQLPRYRALGLTTTESRQASDGHTYTVETIPDWNKRRDHRHHAIDALVVASTKQGFIKQLSTLTAKGTRDFLYNQVKEKSYAPGKLLERYLIKQRSFTTKEVEDAAAGVLISIKSGKRVATRSLIRDEKKTRGKNRITGVLTPRGPLSEESVYGKIKLLTPHQPLKLLFEHPDRIVKDYIREKVLDRLKQYDGGTKKALASTKTDPIFLDEEKKTVLQYASCYKDKYVIRYPVSNINIQKIPDIIDPVVRSKIRQRFELFDNDEKKALQGLDENPIWYNEEKKIAIKTVRCLLTKQGALEPLRQTDGISYAFVKTGSNHHIALYKDAAGNITPHLCTFWHAVDRKKYGLPIIIHNPAVIWQEIRKSSQDLPASFLDKLPGENLIYWMSLQQNEMFLLGMEQAESIQALDNHDYKCLSSFLYRVQKMSISEGQINIVFRHHLETELDDSSTSKALKSFYNTRSIGAFINLNPIKIKINHIGKIVIT